MPEFVLFKYQYHILRNHSGQWLTPLLLYILICSLFPLTVQLGTNLQPFATGILWIGLLLASLLSMETLFRHEYESGFLEQIVLSHIPLWRWVLVKVFTQWLFTVLPLLIVIPINATLLSFPIDYLPLLLVTIFIGSLAIYFIGAIGAALVVTLPSAGLLLALIILPLYIPILIFAVGAVTNAMQSIDSNALLWLSCCSLLAVTLTPIATSSSLKLHLS